MPVNTLMQTRRGTASAWTSANPVLAEGEWGYETDTKLAKCGNGSTAWNSLDYRTLPIQTSNSGKFLTTNGTTPSWAVVDAFPSQTSNSGKFLTTNGTATSWAAAVAPADYTAKGVILVATGAGAYTAQSVGTNGQVLTANSAQADGVEWTTLDALPSQTGNSGKYLTTNGSAASWSTIVTDPTPSIFMLMGA
jgi:hypothetical protein